LDETRSLVRFTPRKSKNWSHYNIDRALKLVSKRKMTEAGRKVLPQDVISSLRKKKTASSPELKE